jgi:hypothetical protein
LGLNKLRTPHHEKENKILDRRCSLRSARNVFFHVTIQTAWLGSFPGRDIELYTRWTYMQLAASIAFLVAAIASFVKAWRIRE